MSKHTPGPWDIGAVNDGIIITNNHDHIAKLRFAEFHNDRKTLEADANLIAASPDLLAACLEFIECGRNAGHNADLIEQMQTAIAKATGERHE